LSFWSVADLCGDAREGCIESRVRKVRGEGSGQKESEFLVGVKFALPWRASFSSHALFPSKENDMQFQL